MSSAGRGLEAPLRSVSGPEMRAVNHTDVAFARSCFPFVQCYYGRLRESLTQPGLWQGDFVDLLTVGSECLPRFFLFPYAP